MFFSDKHAQSESNRSTFREVCLFSLFLGARMELALCAVIYHKNSLKSVLLLLFKAFTGEFICLKTFHKEKRKKILYFCCFSKYFWSTFHLTRVAVPDSNGLITAPCVLKQLVYWFLLEMAVEITCWISLY